jgi:hypothetical protein
MTCLCTVQILLIFPAASDMNTYLSVSRIVLHVILLGLDCIYYLHVPTLSYVSFLSSHPQILYSVCSFTFVITINLTVWPDYISSVYVEWVIKILF